MLIGPKSKSNGKLAYLVKYHKYRLPGGHVNPQVDANSRLIMDLKIKDSDSKARQAAVEHFVEELDPCIASRLAIAVVPSHDPAKKLTGIRRVARRLAARKDRIDAVPCLVRTVKVAEKKAGGSRDIQIDLKSIRVHDRSVIAGRSVVLLDDVMTSGNSLRACRRLLLAAGAAAVQCLAIGKTV